MIKKMGVVPAINAVDMKREQIGTFGS